MSTKESIEELRDEIRKLRDELQAAPRITYLPMPVYVHPYPYYPYPYTPYIQPTITWTAGNALTITANSAATACAPQFAGYITSATVE